MESNEMTDVAAPAAVGAVDAPPVRKRGRPMKAVKPEAVAAVEVEAAPLPVETSIPADSFRPEIRPSFREEDPRARAARRALELREHGGALEEGTDEFFIPLNNVPPGWTYEWKRHTIFGKEDPAYAVQIARAGWEPVPSRRHPEMMPSGYRGDTIERKGMILMERPLEISEEARNMELRKARSQVRQKEQQLAQAPQGQFERDNKGNPLANVRKSYEALPIPKD